jgi:hypothetical protein
MMGGPGFEPGTSRLQAPSWMIEYVRTPPSKSHFLMYAVEAARSPTVDALLHSSRTKVPLSARGLGGA